ncbi:MAG: serine acetyltransferase [Bacteroidales bacterium]|nr:serine acetyltransferase [Bacteroidales bacterium]
MNFKNQAFAERLSEFNTGNCMEVPSMVQTHEFVDNLIHTLFPIKRNSTVDAGEIAMEMDRCAIKLEELLYSIRKSLDAPPEVLVEEFFSRVPAAFHQLVADANSITRFDPAARGVSEIILCYPGFFCISVYRMAHILYDLKVPVLPRVMSEYAHEKTGIDIHPGAEIASPFFIDHGTGVVIGETAQIGKEVKIYQGVTLGALSVDKEMANTKRHPTIEDHVIIYAGSTILGGNTVIGHHTVVGGNTWITESIIPYSVVFRNHRVVVKDSKEFDTPNDFFI